jgi:hypothetical protein
MFWNDITIDMMIMIYVVGLFTLIIVCLYALIQSRANKLYTFIIIPLALLIASMTWQGIKALQGMPIHGLPMDQKIQVMFVNDNKPWIYVLLNSEDGPKFYKIEWTEENKKKMKELQQKIGTSYGEGKFKEGNPGESDSFFFTPMDNMSEPEAKDPNEEDRTPVSIDSSGVSYTTTTVTGGGPRPDGNTRPNLNHEVAEEVIFIRNPEIETVGWSTQLLFPEHKKTEKFIGPLNEGKE